MGANAQTAVPAFTAGQVLTAAQMTQVNTGIPVFASSTERDAAFGGAGEKTLAEGQYAFLEDTNETQVYDGSAWAAVGQPGGKILQVVSATKTDTFTATSTATWEDVSGLSVAITPSATSSKILVVGYVNMAGAYDRPAMRLVRGSTAIGVGTTAGSRISVSGAGYMLAGADTTTVAVNYLDSPSTTSATTYKIQVIVPGSPATAIYVNRSITDTDSNSFVRSASTITVMEVSA